MISEFPLKTCSITVASGSKSGFCERYSTLTELPFIILPSSAASTPAIIFNNVDFPVPLMPITPDLSPSFMPRFILLSNCFSL